MCSEVISSKIPNWIKENKEILQDYFSMIKERSDNTLYAQKHIIKECIEAINKPILEIQKRHTSEFIKTNINKRNITRGKNKGQSVTFSTKEQYCRYLKSFFDYIEFMSDEELNYRSPVPPIKQIVRKLLDIGNEIERTPEIEVKKFTKDEILEILKLSKVKNFEDFILFTILTVTGMRISECLTIKIENIKLNERYIETGLVKNSRKSTIKTKKSIIFFFPISFKSYIENFIIWSERKSGWLFQNKRGNRLSDATLRYRITKKYGEKWQHFHKFRDSIVTYRTEMECPEVISEILVNHAPTTTQRKHYVNLSIRKKRELYDKWFPYYDLVYF